MMSSDCIQVAIRIRPLVERELNCGYQNILRKIGNEPQLSIDGARSNNCLFTFNHVFTDNDSQETVYTESVQNMINKLFEGYNVTILAYGQTGSGKTHTMGTNYKPGDDMGIIPRAVQEIFKNISKLKYEHNISIKCSFVELYNEHLFDLLSTASNRDDCIVDIREDAIKGIIMPGLTENEVTSTEEIINNLIKGSGGRAIGATAMNAESSRSHAIFTITVEVARKDNPSMKTSSRFHLVDLAGSERSKKTQATGNRLKEGIKINQGLFALGKVISALGSQNPSSFVPYRESKLTRLLQDSLGGNSVTLLIACVSPADYNLDETLNTLNYANRAKNIKNKPIINHDPDAVELENWEKKAQALRLEILNLENISCLPVDNDGNMSIIEMESIAKLKDELNEIQQKSRNKHSDLRNACSNKINVETRGDLIEKAYSAIVDIVDEINTAIKRIMETKIPETCLSYLHKLETIAQEMKALLMSTANEMDKLNEDGAKVDDDEPVIMDEHANDISTDDDENDEMAENQEEISVEQHQQKQLGFTNHIQAIDKEIAIREDMVKRLIGNISNFLSEPEDTMNIHAKNVELETKIKSLEAERVDLMDQLLLDQKSSTATTKVAEDRLTKIAALETETTKYKKQYKQQKQLLELREADTQRLNQLTAEIKELKITKVRISREMRKANDQFKKWQRSKDMEISKIKQKAKKKKLEIIRQSMINYRKQTVLKRKIAEAYAGIKQLEIKIEKKRSAQLSRRRGMVGKTGCIKSEIDVILTITENEINLEHLKQSRDNLLTVIGSLKRQKPLQTVELAEAEKQLKQQNHQIGILHQFIMSSKKEDKIKKLIDEIGTVEESREAAKYLYREISYLIKESSEKDTQCNIMKKSNEVILNQIQILETKQSNLKNKHLSDLNCIERRNEEQIASLLRELQFRRRSNGGAGGSTEPTINQSHRVKLTEEANKKKTEYLKILSDLDHENEQLQQELDNLHEQAERAAHQSMYDENGDIEIDMFNDEVYEDDVEQDPDWKLPQETTRNRSHNNNSNPNNSTGTTKKHKLSTELIKCGCSKNCATKSCKCRKNNAKCNDKCKCNAACSNVDTTNDDKDVGNGDSENNKNSININLSTDGITNHSDYMKDESTPKKQKLSINEMDVTTPCYPYAKKDRLPFFRGD